MLTQPDRFAVRCSTLVELLSLRALENPAVGFTFHSDRQGGDIDLTYAEMYRQSLRIAALLQRHHAQSERVLLLYQPSLDFITAFFGCLYAGAVAVTAFPPRFNRNLTRLKAIVEDAQPKVGLSTTNTLAALQSLFQDDPILNGFPWLDTNREVEGLEESDFCDPVIDGDTIAFLQYTSGSTAKPKGVMLSHANLLHNSELIARSFGFTPDGIGVSWLPPYHDMGLIGGILQPLYVGGPMILMSPLSFLQQPVRWLQIISRCKGKTTLVSGGPNFAYDLCVRRISPEQKQTLDLTQWDVAFVGAEPVKEETLRLFAEAFEPCGFRAEAFYPCYGLAEATLMVSGGSKRGLAVTRKLVAAELQKDLVVETTAATSHENIRLVVGNGKALPSQKIVIVEPESLTLCAPDKVGEIWVAGPSVAQGYWRRSEETSYTFDAFLADTGEGPFLRTGDLGFLSDGELFVTGRIKDLIIIEGRNHYPQDIELTVERSHPAIRSNGCAAFPMEIDNQERLVILAEIEHRHLNTSLEEITKLIRQAVAEEHDIRAHSIRLVKAGNIPRTSSGKIQRYNCRAVFRNGAGLSPS